MCTAITYKNQDHYFGRNLDLEYSYHETVTITPRDYPFQFRMIDTPASHYAMVGMATVVDNYPLYYDATNEQGLSMAGLHFPGNAVYLPVKEDARNIAPFAFIPWVLSQCSTISQVRRLLCNTNLMDADFSPSLPHSPLHWLIADELESIVVEPTADGLKIFDNPIGVLTNNPPFEYHIHYLSNFLNLSPKEPENRFSSKIKLVPYSRAIGAFGLPGDASSSSRFVRAAFHKLNSVSDGTEAGNVGQFFHILDSVAMVNGSVHLGEKLDKTVYSCCCNTSKGIYYYTTYENRQITAVRLTQDNMTGAALSTYPLRKSQAIHYERL